MDIMAGYCMEEGTRFSDKGFHFWPLHLASALIPSHSTSRGGLRLFGARIFLGCVPVSRAFVLRACLVKTGWARMDPICEAEVSRRVVQLSRKAEALGKANEGYEIKDYKFYHSQIMTCKQ